ncbi:hypothetical protein M758_1G082900, partial [Ceratodon purpureus]
MLMQEHRYNAKDCSALTSQLHFLEGPSLWNKESYSAKSDKTKARTAILLSRRLQESIISCGIILAGREQYLVLQLNPNLRLGILNIYAHNDSRRQTKMWDTISVANLPSVEWILGVDFNSVESLNDRIGGSCNTCMEAQEIEAWSRLLLHHNLGDSFHMPEFRRLNKKRFSRDNTQK